LTKAKSDAASSYWTGVKVKTTNNKNSIENYFSMSKSRLQKLEGLKYENLKENKEKYENICKGAL
jgi:hypothetical protein